MTETLCNIAGCEKRHLSLGYCSAHYNRLKRHGDPFGGGSARPKQGYVLRFFQDVVLAHDGDDCLIWPFARWNGYAQMSFEGKTRWVSRLVCEEEHGPPPSSKHEAAHICGKGNLGCVSRRHLFWRTPVENASDKYRHGTPPRGERCGTSKLTADDVREIRALADTCTQASIAERFGIKPNTVSGIVSGKSWGWLDATAPGAGANHA
jgi:hypothetical protein